MRVDHLLSLNILAKCTLITKDTPHKIKKKMKRNETGIMYKSLIAA